MAYYLDDMHLYTGDKVLCKSSIACLDITAGMTYTVVHRDYGSRHNMLKGIINDKGEFCCPSARFERVN